MYAIKFWEEGSAEEDSWKSLGQHGDQGSGKGGW